MSTRRGILLALSGAIAVFSVVFPTNQSSDAGERVQQTATMASVPSTAAPASPSPLPVTSSSTAVPTPGSPTSTIQSTRDSAPTPFQPVAPAAPSSFVVQGAAGIITSAEVDAFKAEFNDEGTMQPVHPPDYERAVWVEQTSPPAFPSSGATALYVHACQYHDNCPGTPLTLDSVHAGDRVVVTTSSGVLTYLIDRVDLAAKGGLLPDWANDTTVRERIVLVTCNFEGQGVSLQNVVIVGHLVASASS